MAQRDFILEYEFTSTRADGDSYTRRRVVKASDEKSALFVARMVGFSEFGERFTENCFDWRVINP